MNKHLVKVIEKVREDIEFDYAMEHGNEDTTFIIFHSWDDREKFVAECREYTSLENAYDYQIEQELDCELVFDDEYATCGDCHHIIRTSPTHYGWQPDFYMGDGFIVCGECFRNQSDYQESYIEERINNPKNAVNGLITEQNLQSIGFRKLNEDSYERGFHEGQTDDPEEIFEDLENKYYEVLFAISSVGQFDMNFDVWVRGEI